MTEKNTLVRIRPGALALTLGVLSAWGGADIARGEEVTARLFDWERGLGVRAAADESMAVYLWFYEWNMFEAVRPGQHTRGTHQLKHTLAKDGNSGSIAGDFIRLSVRAVDDGAELKLTLRNTTDYEFPPIAAIIPCFNPGPAQTRNNVLANTNTYFLAEDGLEKLQARQIHFNHTWRAAVDREAKDGKYVWSSKWPLSQTDAVGGLLVRESSDGRWVTGIAWSDFLSAQGHNPWECMHLSVRVGPLKPGESKTVRGRIYLFEGDRQELLKRYRRDFPASAGR